MLDRGFKTDFTTIPQQMVVFKTHELLTDQDIIEMLEERAIKKKEIPYSCSTWSNILLVKKKASGLLMYIFKNTQQLFSLFHSVMKHKVCFSNTLSRKTIFSPR